MPDNTTTPNAQSGSTKEQAGAAKDKAAAAASSAAETAKTQARDVADTVSNEATNYAYQARDTAADEVKGVASALRTAADELRSGSPQERSFSQLADGLADVSDSMRDKDLGEMVDDLNGFAKRNPMVFLGGAALLGFVATRFAKASSDSPRGGYAGGGTGVEYDDDDRMDRPMTGTGPRPASNAPSTAPSRATATPASPSVVTGEKS
ncbi:hypothetical protein [Sulfitobacter sp. PS-8MA]|uniref:hypothetical protein n=1 Tax=Sulfitobacter sp. PS-8MA TaxID=3237707 RepID=UPI0034C6BD1B